ncbi:iron chelate uptake ABC transporter family permease subunit [Corynebacterium sp. CCM 8862]|uniref:Iron chelate uptake ABC transporter family permease subunit n=2 Tax=Corynebacterium mendelii TaxID=2765362 RepID=A0A939E0V6_9CORY|nr:iron chelate uptake ABC transporter family permease subunit [Corynebacterium mendelii]
MVFRQEKRGIIVAACLLVAIAVVSVWSLMTGDYPVSAGGVLATLAGAGTDSMAGFFILELRAPRVVLALLLGAALGISGAIFQTLTANPLGSPDITGFTTGAATGAIIQIIVIGGGPLAIGLGALFGGAATGVTVYLLSRRQGVTGTRFVLIGIGVAAILQGVNGLLIVKASLTAAQTAAQWLAGSLNATGWGKVTVIAMALAVLVPAAFVLARPLTVLVTGADLATGLGVNVPAVRAALIVVGVGLVAVAVSAAGPIAFVALAAPQLAKRLTGSSGAGMGNAGLMGALLVVASDLVAMRIVAPVQLPVGIVTGSLGGIYLIWLLSRQWKKEKNA